MTRSMAFEAIFLFLIAGCATPLTPRESGTLAGASIGAATGAIFGGIAGSAGQGAAIGAVVGAMAGALTGDAIQAEQAARAYPPGAAYGAPRYPYASPPGPATATLEIEATPGETEIVVDGKRIGLVKEFRGPALVPVAAGPHVVEFRWKGFSVMSQVVVPYGATIPIKRDLAPSASLPPPRSPSGAGRPSSH